MEPLNHLASFVQSAEGGSFSAAARRLGLTPAAVSKNVARLEARLGVRLFQRSTRRLTLTEGPHAALVSRFLGADVRLAAVPRGGVVFGDPVTLVGTATLRDLAERLGRPVEAARFRATLLVETDEPYVEDTWLGAEIGVGAARLRVGVRVPRCAVIDHDPDTGAKDLRLLRALVGSRPTNAAAEPVLGVYAACVRPGVVAVP